jgi:hypothetical protein
VVQQLEQWRLTKDLDVYLAEMTAAASAVLNPAEREAADQWLAWASGYRRKHDPLGQPLSMPPDRRPQKEEPRPFLDGWSPYGPDGSDL